MAHAKFKKRAQLPSTHERINNLCFLMYMWFGWKLDRYTYEFPEMGPDVGRGEAFSPCRLSTSLNTSMSIDVVAIYLVGISKIPKNSHDRARPAGPTSGDPRVWVEGEVFMVHGPIWHDLNSAPSSRYG